MPAEAGIMTQPDEENRSRTLPIVDLGAIDDALDRGPEALRKALQRFRPADVGRDFSRRDMAESQAILRAADERRAAAMLRATHPAVAAKLLASAEASWAVSLLQHLPTDQQVAILGAMPAQSRAAIEGALDPADKAKVARILAHGETAVARMMTPKIWRCDAGATVGEAMAILRAGLDRIEVAQNCYFTEGDRLVGVAPLRELAVTDSALAVAEIMTRDPIAVREDTERGDAAEIIQTHDFLSLPVVDDSGRLVGAVRVDDLLDAALAKFGAGFLNQGGVAGKIAARLPYFQTPLLKVVRSRITWLLLLFVAETATGAVLRSFESELAKVVALSFFIPLLIGTGGNAGSQTVSTIIRALALGEVQLRDSVQVVLRESLSGLALGIVLGAIGFVRAMLWGVGPDLAACVAVTVVAICAWATTVGSVIPLLMQRLGVDPTVTSGPMITTLVDASGLFIYLSIAGLMVAQLQG